MALTKEQLEKAKLCNEKAQAELESLKSKGVRELGAVGTRLTESGQGTVIFDSKENHRQTLEITTKSGAKWALTQYFVKVGEVTEWITDTRSDKTALLPQQQVTVNVTKAENGMRASIV